MVNIKDWCISRQLWWGHRVPVWHRESETRCQIDSPGEGWRQDPDVLDTWFSSWLWPFATMGWPAKTETLRKFYPTTDLVTGPGHHFFLGRAHDHGGLRIHGRRRPSRNVYFTGIIRDKQGRKMSKSLGNSPDPLDLIGQYGADALRFGVMRSAPLGQDVLYDEQQVELGRNFCNKLWNACRFRQLQAGEVQGEIDAAAAHAATTNGFCSGSTPPSAKWTPPLPNTSSATPPPRSTGFSGASIATGMSRRARRRCKGPMPRAGQHAGGDGFCPVAHAAVVSSVPAVHHGGIVARDGLRRGHAGGAGRPDDRVRALAQTARG